MDLFLKRDEEIPQGKMFNPNLQKNKPYDMHFINKNMSYMTDHAGPRRYKCNPVFQIGARGIFNLVLKLHNPMENCGT